MLYFYINQNKVRRDVITTRWHDARGVLIENLLVGHVSFGVRC
jgi:hypothetical protein